MYSQMYRMFIGIVLLASTLACTRAYHPELPASIELGTPHGYRVVRVTTHMHTPYSFDACDSKGVVEGVVNSQCLSSLRSALCQNRIDVAFLTDHPDHMASYEFNSLLLDQGQDVLLPSSATPWANRMSGCADGHVPVALVGFEDRLMALGMTGHLSGTVAERNSKYRRETREGRDDLVNEADALVAIPHTESRSVELIKEIEPHAIEIFNLHANLDPKIRKRDLGVSPYRNIPALMSYLIDPYRELEPDFMVLWFLEAFPKYRETWNALAASGVRLTGIAANDSHENVLAQKLSDGERLDSFRRLLRLVSNHVLIPSFDLDQVAAEVKTALRAGRSWMAFESLGSPVGFDFSVLQNANTFILGSQVSLAAGAATLHVSVPSVHSSGVTRESQQPVVRTRVVRALEDGSDEILAESTDTGVSVPVTQIGMYRAEIWIRPRHLKPFLGTFSLRAEEEFPWVLSNFIEVTP